MRECYLSIMLMMKHAFESKHGKGFNTIDLPITKAPTIKDQFGKRKPQGYKKHLRNKNKK